MSKKPTVLMILDGYGLNDKTEGNAVAENSGDGQPDEGLPFCKGECQWTGSGTSGWTDGKF